MRIVPIVRSKGDLADIPPTRAAVLAHVREWYPDMPIHDVELGRSGPSAVDETQYSAAYATSPVYGVRDMVASVNRFRDWPLRMMVFAVEDVSGQPCRWPVAVIDAASFE